MATPPTTRSPLGVTCIRLRQARGWSQQVLATKCGISMSTIRDIESQGAEPRLEILRRLRAAFMIDYNTLVAEPEQTFTDAELEEAYEEISRVQARARQQGDKALAELARSEGKRILRMLSASDESDEDREAEPAPAAAPAAARR